MKHLLKNIVWHTLGGPHASFCVGAGAARRYAPGFPAFVAFADPGRPDFDALARLVATEEPLYHDGRAWRAPQGWRIEAETVMAKMIWDRALPAGAAPGAVRLGVRHGGDVHALAAQVQPGPFGPRSPELGGYFGFFEGARLVAMACDRACAGGFAEISAVCVHPAFRGRGLAQGLVRELIRQQMLRGRQPFLRVTLENAAALALYRRIGFTLGGESVARVFVRC